MLLRRWSPAAEELMHDSYTMCVPEQWCDRCHRLLGLSGKVATMVYAHQVLAQKTEHLPLLNLIERVSLTNGLTAALRGLSVKEGSHNGAFCETGERTSKLLPDLLL